MSQPTSQRDPKSRFSDRVEFYIRSRPKYPPALLDFCRLKLGLQPNHQIADIGSGTGFLTDLFLQNGNVVFGVEPNGPMRKAAEARLSSRSNFRSIDATAESTTLASASIDFVLAGQAFHWFDRARARDEFNRILRPSGWVILVWNERRIEAGGFNQRYGEIVKTFQTESPEIVERRRIPKQPQEMAKFFVPDHAAVETFANSQKLDLDGLIARALSSSNLPLPGQPRSEEMLDELRKAFSDCAVGGKVQMDYDTRAFYGHLS